MKREVCAMLVAVFIFCLLPLCEAASPTRSPTTRTPTRSPIINSALTYNPTPTSGSSLTFNPTPTSGVNDTFNPTPTFGIADTFNPTPTSGIPDTFNPTPFSFPSTSDVSSEISVIFYIKDFPLTYFTTSITSVLISELVTIISSAAPQCSIQSVSYQSDYTGSTISATRYVASSVSNSVNLTSIDGEISSTRNLKVAVGASPTRSPTRRPTLQPTCKPTSKPTFGPTFMPTSTPTSNPISQLTSKPTSTFGTVEVTVIASTSNPTFAKTSIASYMASSFSISALIQALNSACTCSVFNSISLSYSIVTPYIVNYVSFSTLVDYTEVVDRAFLRWFMYVILPVVVVIYICCLAATTYRTDNSELQTYFYYFFSALSTVNMLFDVGNTFSSCFSSYRYLWASIAVTWMLPSICFFASTIVKNQLIPYYIIDSYIGWWCLFKRYNVNIFWLWLGQSRGLPLVNSKKLSFSFEYHDSLPKVLIYILTWLVLILAQLMCLIPFFLWSLILLPYTAILFIVGLFLFQTKLLVHQVVWNKWCALFTSRSLQYDKDVVYDTKYFNELLVIELLFNNIPQVILKLVNNRNIDESWLYPFATSWVSIVAAAVGLIRYVFLPLVYGHMFDEVPFHIKIRYSGSTHRFGMKKAKYYWTTNHSMRKVYIDYWTDIYSNSKADLLYETTHRLLLSTFFSADDVDNVSNIKANREPLLLALRARGLYHVSTLQMAVETINLLQRDSCDNTLYKYLRSIEVREPIDLIDLTEASKKVIISHINYYKVRELVTANLNLLLLNNIGIKQLLAENRDTNGGKINSKFLLRNYHHLMFPLVKTSCGHADVGIHQDREGLYVCELNELSLKAGLHLYDRVLMVNETAVNTPEEFNILVTQSSRNRDERKMHHQVNLLIARMNTHSIITTDEIIQELYTSLDRSVTVARPGSRRLSNIKVLLHMSDRELLKVFNIIDSDGSGSIQTNELQVFLEQSGLGGTRTARKMIDLADADGDGHVSKDEFLAIMKLIQGSNTTGRSSSSEDPLYKVTTSNNEVVIDFEEEKGGDRDPNDKSVMMQEIEGYIDELKQLTYWHELKHNKL